MCCYNGRRVSGSVFGNNVCIRITMTFITSTYNYTISLRNKDSKLNAFSMYTGILENANPLPGRFKN